MTPIRLYIFDADETLRTTRVAGQPCPHHMDEWVLLPGVRARLQAIPWSAHGPFFGVASNQDHVGYGLLPLGMAHQLLVAMTHAAVGTLLPPPAIRLCPHTAAEHCACRKPAPGMLLAIMSHFRVAAGETLFVGDAESDREAARRAGAHFMDACRFFGEFSG